ncbi:thiaminase II [Salimicrobium salexigens]|uniref:Aminopyrimidine aminohydrolase n=1 Tax=Salimicrobium salexigens TaxID=908941 RepID=A0ABY1KKU3_9BACI|nr:thiaminase II [Salimicrobium salexigens]SIS46524.1 thiaminase (transcriptional activator TenA) [Salimicrobium salexigens]
MSFTKELRRENEDVFQAIFDHPFVQGLGEGELPKEAVAHYVKADYEYLNTFLTLYGTAISQSDSREDITFFHNQIAFVLGDEMHPHRNLSDYAGTPYENLQGYPMPPTADHYRAHMKSVATEGLLGKTIAAMLPCPWTYDEIGKELKRRFSPESDHPFYEWIEFYADDSIAETTGYMMKRLDEEAERASPEDRRKMKEAFRKSCQLELAFWEMSYSLEEWPAGKEAAR